MAVMATRDDRLVQMALDLHDGPLQDVAFLLGHLRALRDEIVERVPRAALLSRVDELEPVLVELDGGLRSLVASVEEGLGPRRSDLADVVARFERRTGAGVDVLVEHVAVPDEVADALVHVAQEALENVRRHSGAGSVALQLRATPRGCVLEVHDDGRGFDPSRSSNRLGIAGMRRRMARCGGTFAVESSPGRGTTVRASYTH